MAEQVAIEGFKVPPAPTGATQHSREGGGGVPQVPPAAQQQPGYVAPTPAPQNGFTDADAAELAAFRAQAVAAAQAAANAKPATPPTPAAPTPRTTPVDPVSQLNVISNNVETDPMLSSYIGVLNAGVPNLDQNRAFGNALAYGDPNLIDVAYLREAAGSNADNMIAMAKGLVEYVVRETEAVTDEIYTAAGGQAQWDAATAAFNKGAPPHLKSAVKVLIDSARRADVQAGAKMVIDFAKASGLIAQPGVQVQAGGAQPHASLGLSKEGFQAELRKLNRNDQGYNLKYQELAARRQLGKQNGM